MLPGDEISHFGRPSGDRLFSILTPAISAPGAAQPCPRTSIVQTMQA